MKKANSLLFAFLDRAAILLTPRPTLLFLSFIESIIYRYHCYVFCNYHLLLAIFITFNFFHKISLLFTRLDIRYVEKLRR